MKIDGAGVDGGGVDIESISTAQLKFPSDEYFLLFEVQGRVMPLMHTMPPGWSARPLAEVIRELEATMLREPQVIAARGQR